MPQLPARYSFGVEDTDQGRVWCCVPRWAGCLFNQRIITSAIRLVTLLPNGLKEEDLKPVFAHKRVNVRSSRLALGFTLAGLAVTGTVAQAQSWNINFAGRDATDEYVTVADGTDPIGMGGGTWNNLISPGGSWSWDPSSPLSIVEADGGTSINLDWGPSGSLRDHDANISGTYTDLNKGWFGHWDNFEQTLNFTNIPAGTYDVTVYFTWIWNENSVDYEITTGTGSDLGTKTLYPDQSTAASYNQYVEGNNFLVFENVSPDSGNLDLHIFNTEDGGISAIQITTRQPTLTVVVNTITGEAELKNMADEAVTFDYYLIGSAAGALDANTWNSMDDQEADPAGFGWVEAGGSNDTQLAELNLTDAITLAANESVSLGDAFDTTVFGSGIDGDLTFRYGVPGRSALGYGVVTYVTSIPGDLDGDGFVGLSDLDLILNNWNMTIPDGDPAADPSGDDFVGLDDLDIVLNNWNAGTPPTVAVPEPASMAMGLLGAGLCVLRRR